MLNGILKFGQLVTHCCELFVSVYVGNTRTLRVCKCRAQRTFWRLHRFMVSGLSNVDLKRRVGASVVPSLNFIKKVFSSVFLAVKVT